MLESLFVLSLHILYNHFAISIQDWSLSIHEHHVWIKKDLSPSLCNFFSCVLVLFSLPINPTGKQPWCHLHTIKCTGFTSPKYSKYFKQWEPGRQSYLKGHMVSEIFYIFEGFVWQTYVFLNTGYTVQLQIQYFLIEQISFFYFFCVPLLIMHSTPVQSKYVSIS